MTGVSDLMGVGVPAAWANLEGIPPSAAITAAGTTASDATVMGSGQSFVVLTATGSDGVRLSTNMPLNIPYFCTNTSASTCLIYPPTGANFNGGTTNAPLSILTKKSAIVIRYSATALYFNMSA